jgi:hypothetical protein
MGARVAMATRVRGFQSGFMAGFIYGVSSTCGTQFLKLNPTPNRGSNQRFR